MQSTNMRLLFGNQWLSLRRCMATMLVIMAVSFTTIFGILLVAAVGTAVAVPAKAATVEQVRAVVSYRDLDLTDAAGVAELKRRVDRAARRLCMPVGVQIWFAHWRPSKCIATASEAGYVQIEHAVAASSRTAEVRR